MRTIFDFVKHLFFTRRLFQSMAAVALLFLLSYGMSWLFIPSVLLLLLLLLFVLLDTWALFSRRKGVSLTREMAERFSNGDDNLVTLHISNNYPFALDVRIIDEVPDQFQLRDFHLDIKMKAGGQQTMQYKLRPVLRGEYRFGNINALLRSPLRLVMRRQVTEVPETVAVYPSFHHMRKYQLLAHTSNQEEAGNKKMRKVGHSLEFEQIRDYVTGDDIRRINWKATARKGGHLMVNNYTDERSQQIYCIIDKSRAMQMPFDGMSLLDYAINASLALSQVALIRYDKAGIITFDENMGTHLPAERRGAQMNRILGHLYRQETNFLESDFEKLHLLVRSQVKQRSLIVLFTNFESMSALERQMPFLRSIARMHLLLIVFFENTGLRELTEQPADDLEGLYSKTIAEKFVYEKKLMVRELYKYGILSILTPPQQVTVNTVNKYLELKSRLTL